MAGQTQTPKEGESVPIEVVRKDAEIEAKAAAAFTQEMKARASVPGTSPAEQPAVVEESEVPEITGAPPVPKSPEQVQKEAQAALAEIYPTPGTQPVEPEQEAQATEAPPPAQTTGSAKGEEGPVVIKELDPAAERQLRAIQGEFAVRKGREKSPVVNTIQALRQLEATGNALVADPGNDIRYARLIEEAFHGTVTRDVEMLEAATAQKIEQAEEKAQAA